MNAESPQLKGWRRAVEQLESAALDVWARPVVVMVAGFALAAAALLAGRMLPQPMRLPAETGTLAGLAILAVITLWRTRATVPDVLAREIVARVVRARELMRGLPADVHTSLAEDIGRLTQPISPWSVAALTAFAMLVATMAAAATAGLSAAILPQLGQLNIAAGLSLAALLLPGYVRLVTITAAQRLEERAVLVERLVEIATRD
jgi:hypothetical protein